MIRATDNHTQAAHLPRSIFALSAALHFAFFLASILIIPIMARGARIPNPFGPDSEARAFVHAAAAAVRVSDFLQLASALCLAIYCGLMADRIRAAQRTTAAFLTLAGGLGAAMMLSITALCSWAIASPGATDWGSSFHTLQFMPFLFGGPGWAGFIAIFLCGASAGMAGLAPRWLNVSGYALGGVAALATAVLLTILASPCLPLARFLGFIWMIIAAASARRELPS